MEEIEAIKKIIAGFDPTHANCREQISLLRRQMEESWECGKITTKEWRDLLDQIAKIQAKCHPRS